MKHKIVIIAFIIISLFANILRETDWNNRFYKYDISGYHIYLPAIFIYNDLATLSFFDSVDKKYPVSGSPWYGITEMPDGKRLNKYTMGVAILELPFFLLAHIYNTIAGHHPPDGYSLPYAYGSIVSTIFWSALGLLYLRRLLKHYYSENVVTVTLIAIGFGTNLYAYNAYSQGMSHPYSFFLFAAGLFYTDQWYRQFKLSQLILIAVITGLITIIRPLNALFVLIPVFWRVANWGDIKARFSLFASRWKDIAIAIPFFVAILFILLGYWKYITGSWVYYTYGKESFLWLSPRIFDGLFGIRKGWFIYSPVVFIAILGFYKLWKTHKQLVPVLVLFLVLHVYATFCWWCWWCWWYGGGFGARTLIDILPVVALPFAALCKSIFNRQSLIPKISFTILIVLLSGLSMLQGYQGVKNIIHYDRMTWPFYWRVFGKLQIPEEDYKLILDDEHYWKEYERLDPK